MAGELGQVEGQNKSGQGKPHDRETEPKPSLFLVRFKAVQYLSAHLQPFRSTATHRALRQGGAGASGSLSTGAGWGCGSAARKQFVAMRSHLPSEAASAVSSEKAGKKLQLAACSSSRHFSIGVGTSLGSCGLMGLLTYSSRESRLCVILDLSNAA